MSAELASITDCYRTLLKACGDDATRQGLVKTPERAARAFQVLTQGYQQSIDEIINDALFASDTDEMVIVKNIELFSLCEHHLLPFFGKCHIGYLPNGNVLGVSKLVRIVDCFARRLQIQENLTQQIALCIKEATKAKGVGVIIEAQHLCMMMRGVEKQNSLMLTSKMVGLFKSRENTRQEFLALIN